MTMPLGEFGELADALCGCPIRELPENAGMDRLTRAVAGRWLAYCEDNLKSSAFGRIGDVEHALRYLDLIVTEGYELADIETQLHQSITARLAEEPEDDRDEAEDVESNPEEDFDTEEDADDTAHPEALTTG